ncbi:ImmA/IrrE family metallo-endopeptidase [Enterococcus thailandicus]|uniref:ImmA/IrrE family metallo-endopeptidase n=1 Tax=Enterococcus thailandicus TaxID=417368 RepID=UPI0039A621F9
MLVRLKEMLSDYNLNLIYMKMDESGFYYPKAKTVFLNEKFHAERAESFHLAHELGHFIASHSDYEKLYLSPTFHSKFESEANKIAIAILLNIFIENELTDESQFKIEKFMEFYKIGTHLTETCYSVCTDYFKDKTMCLYA